MNRQKGYGALPLLVGMGLAMLLVGAFNLGDDAIDGQREPLQVPTTTADIAVLAPPEVEGEIVELSVTDSWEDVRKSSVIQEIESPLPEEEVKSVVDEDDSPPALACPDIQVGSQAWRGCNSIEGDAIWRAGANRMSVTESGWLVGGYYLYQDASDACPEGYRLPSVTDWTTLTEQVKDESGTSFNALLVSERLKLPRAGLLIHLGGSNFSWRDTDFGKYWTATTQKGGALQAYEQIAPSSIGAGSIPSGQLSKTLLSVRCIKK
jgi:uncharacterized protein (TIGR02145 family)